VLGLGQRGLDGLLVLLVGDLLALGAAKTMRALAPPAPGNFCSSRSCACWDSVPGTENLLLVWPLNAAALATTRPRTAIHASSTVLRRRKAQPPSR
jgi:hypothetical protein